VTEGTERVWDDHSITLTFKTPLTHEQRQTLALEIEKLFGVVFKDSYECYHLAVNGQTEEPYLYGCEKFDFE
jgi:hypothetical protein